PAPPAANLGPALVAPVAPPVAVAEVGAPDVVAAAAEPPPVEAHPPSERALVLESVEVSDLRFDWHDERLGGTAALALELPRLTLGPRNGAPLTAPVPLALELRVPGVCESL